jgi:hypothetical protein
MKVSYLQEVKTMKKSVVVSLVGLLLPVVLPD